MRLPILMKIGPPPVTRSLSRVDFRGRDIQRPHRSRASCGRSCRFRCLCSTICLQCHTGKQRRPRQLRRHWQKNGQANMTNCRYFSYPFVRSGLFYTFCRVRCLIARAKDTLRHLLIQTLPSRINKSAKWAMFGTRLAPLSVRGAKMLQCLLRFSFYLVRGTILLLPNPAVMIGPV